MNGKVLLVERFKNSWHGKGHDFSISYRSNNLEYCLREDTAEGCVIIDKKECDDDCIKMVTSGPMVDTKLPPNTVDKFDRKRASSSLLLGPGGLEGEFKTLLQEAVNNKEFCGLDKISLDIYTRIWRGLGAKIGKYINGKVEWEEENDKM